MKNDKDKDLFLPGMQELAQRLFTKDTEGFVYGLVDTGLVPDFLPTLFGFPGAEACILTPELHFPEKGSFPVVFFKINGPDSPEWDWACRKEHCTKILFFRSICTLAELYPQMRKLLWCNLPEGERSWLRFYDPAVFFPLTEATDAGQIGHFFGSDGKGGWAVSSWMGLDEDGKLHIRHAVGAHFIRPATEIPMLGATRLEALQEAHFQRMYRMSLRHMQEVNPGQFETPAPETDAMLENAVDDAFYHGIFEEETTPLYVECSFYWGPDFVSRLEWARAIFENQHYSGYVKMRFLHERLQKEKKNDISEQ